MVVARRLSLIFLVLAAVTGTAYAQRGEVSAPGTKLRVPLTRSAQSVPHFAALATAPDQASLQDKFRQARRMAVDRVKVTDATAGVSIKSLGNIGTNISVYIPSDSSPFSAELSASKANTGDAYLNFVNPQKVDTQTNNVLFKQTKGITEQVAGLGAAVYARYVDADSGCELGFKVKQGAKYYIKVDFNYDDVVFGNRLAAPPSGNQVISGDYPLYSINGKGSHSMQWVVDAPKAGWLGYYIVLEKWGSWTLNKVTIQEIDL